MAQNLCRVVLAAILALVVALFAAPSATAAFTDARFRATYLFLDAFSYKIPELKPEWTGTAFCSWTGVTCDNSTAASTVAVHLSGRGLTGYMPQLSYRVIGDNVAVTSIDLSNNDIRGNYDERWGGLKNLQTLDLSNTKLSGALPNSWNGMTALTTIKVANTYTCKNLPSWSLTNLKVIDLSNNDIGGTLADSWSAMTALTTVSITGNNFCGCVPSTWATSTVLTDAAASVGGNLVASDCATSNKCTSSHYVCKNAAAAPLTLSLVAASMLASVLAVVAL